MSYRPNVISLDQLEQAAKTGVELAIDERTSVIMASDPMAAAIDPFGGTFDPPVLSGYTSR